MDYFLIMPRVFNHFIQQADLLSLNVTQRHQVPIFPKLKVEIVNPRRHKPLLLTRIWIYLNLRGQKMQFGNMIIYIFYCSSITFKGSLLPGKQLSVPAAALFYQSESCCHISTKDKSRILIQRLLNSKNMLLFKDHCPQQMPERECVMINPNPSPCY